ncbi:peptidase [Oleiphilus sp. HI0081]|uniref:penicillin-binding protein 1A n=4 Tax=Oleiphilus TaxID=141450 RepID=UPI0007C33891|nr:MULTISPECIES: penicillin-binding protein 1A [unclassified Oleiphilus]KZY76241.1 peptidase [Oleiphilus sp. HI0068]KZY85617.1 peptidase [Oleiphilus sp. HI0072]KZZ29083.1 peptidase [Oleiphilus sp. HI0081]KZY30143.1 peptidase [Oleiphilus sp. HI0043]KZY51994.1 peptidase [Oleiphilus sp. HI0061]
MFRFVRLLSFSAWSLAAMISGAFFLMASFFLYLTPTLPDAEQLKHTQLQTPLRIYSLDSKSIAEFGEKRRKPINIGDSPQNLLNAFIAAEDNRFFEHRGIDIKGLARAATQLVTTGRIQTGGSTITMQVAKNFFLSREKTFIRKFNEIFLAIQIEQSLSKQEILELYLNKIYLGNRAYGVHAAAQVYYGKPIDELNLAQMAMIAGLPKAPSRYNPLANAKRAKIRRNWILDRMLDLEMIDSEQHAEAKSSLITASYHGGSSELYAPYVAEMARREVINRYGSDAYTSGMRVFLTVDSKLQEAASRAVKKGLEDYDKRHGYRGPIKTLDISSEEAIESAISELRSIKTPRQHQAALVLEVSQDSAKLSLKDGQEKTLLREQAEWARKYETVDRRGPAIKSLEDILQTGDVIQVTTSNTETSNEDGETAMAEIIHLSQLPEAQGALISINPDNGAIKALVGGYDFAMSHYNRATQAKRQPGSNFKAFVYLAAIENGTTAASLINDAPIVFEDDNLEAAWRPENSSGKFYGPTRIRKALYNSRNLVSIRLLKETGVRKTLNTIEKFGFDKKDLPRDLSLALGSAGLPPISIARGYAMIANGGYKIDTHLISHIEDNEGNIIFKNTAPIVCRENCLTQQSSEEIDNKETNEEITYAPRIADERDIYILHSMLKDVITKGTGRKALQLKRKDLAGKTGTTNDQKDAWFSGFNTQLETSVWVGFDKPQTLGRREYGSRAALPIWNDFMAVALEGTPNANLPQPDGLVTVRINKETGEQALPGTDNAMFEIFRKELAPKKPRTLPPAFEHKESTQPQIAPEDIF